VISKQYGIALIQVLIIVMVLSVFSLYMSQLAKQHVEIARWNNDKVISYLKVQDAEAELYFSLLTENRSYYGERKLEDYTTSINYFGMPFQDNNGVTISISDQNGYLHGNFPDWDILNALLSTKGYSNEQIIEFQQVLLDYVDLDSIRQIDGRNEDVSTNRNGTFQEKEEVMLVNDLPLDIRKLIVDNSTLYKQSGFNPMVATSDLLVALFGFDRAQQILEYRNNGQLTRKLLMDLTNFQETDDKHLMLMNTLRVKLSANVGEAKTEKDITFYFSPYVSNRRSPITYYLKK